MKDILNLFSGVNIPSNNILYKAFKILCEKYLPKEIEVTYNELKQLKDNNQLIIGMEYRITDYNGGMRIDQYSDRIITSLNNKFDIITTALSKNILNTTCKLKPHIYKNVYGYHIKNKDFQSEVVKQEIIDGEIDSYLLDYVTDITYINKEGFYIPVLLEKEGSLLDAYWYIGRDEVDGKPVDVWMKNLNDEYEIGDILSYAFCNKTTMNITKYFYDRILDRAASYKYIYTNPLGDIESFSFEDVTFKNLYQYTCKYQFDLNGQNTGSLEDMYTILCYIDEIAENSKAIKCYIDCDDTHFYLRTFGYNDIILSDFDPQLHSKLQVYEEIIKRSTIKGLYNNTQNVNIHICSYDISYMHGEILELTDNNNNTFPYDFKNRIVRYWNSFTICKTKICINALSNLGMGFDEIKGIDNPNKNFNLAHWYHTFMVTDEDSKLLNTKNNFTDIKTDNNNCLFIIYHLAICKNISINQVLEEGATPDRYNSTSFTCIFGSVSNIQLTKINSSVLLYYTNNAIIHPLLQCEHLEIAGYNGTKCEYFYSDIEHHYDILGLIYENNNDIELNSSYLITNITMRELDALS